MQALELVKSFYNSDLANDSDIIKTIFHKDCELHWTGSQGFMLLNYDGIVDFFEGIRKSYHQLRFEFSHLFEANDSVVTRHTLYAQTIENSESEMALGHFMAIWEVKDNKLFRCYEISQQADETDKSSMDSYAKRKL
ncbi:nuclear transport factor 2 family protein [Ichthyenterobacterium sp. W332]|uniref:Nuclear transport factor 2 family protein n=1 Tax=Microcosmobacter mediterraneus TaxID=3075607 RepID=A0ABU2YKJ3_9FLAO|nr:nuclear transport factor 2 family protein [Ichthyenterobacterium sp. W332]MDT0558678.1 nuclear transport factor 2 family protein [Ichthyenterobacterium sp. W332]